MDKKAADIFIQAIRAAPELPQAVRENAGKAKDVEERHFDESYFEFLDAQIELNARGAEWTARLKRRRIAMLPFCNRTSIRGRVEIDGTSFSIDVDPKTASVFHWEEIEVIWPESS